MMKMNRPRWASFAKSAFRNGALKSTFCQRGRARNRVSSPRCTASDATLPAAAEHDIRPRCQINANTIRSTIPNANGSNSDNARKHLRVRTDSDTMTIASPSCDLVIIPRSSHGTGLACLQYQLPTPKPKSATSKSGAGALTHH